MGGSFEILLILLFIGAAVFDALSRSAKRRRRMEEMEAEEAGEEAGFPAGAGTRPEWGRSRSAGPEEKDGGGERETADTMVPDDLWAILTGEPRRPPTGREAETPSTPPAEPPERPQVPEPVPSDRWRPGRAGGEEQAKLPEPVVLGETGEPTRRSARWMEGVQRRREGGAPLRGTSGPEDDVREQEKRVYRLPPAPWDELGEISTEEISEGGSRGAPASPDGAPRVALRQRREAATPYTRLVESGDVADLRAAMVLREVLGPPVGFREREGERDIW